MVTYMYIVHVQCNSLLTRVLLHLWVALKTFNPSFRRKNWEKIQSLCSVRVVLAVLLHALPCRMWNSFHLVSTSLSSLHVCFWLPSTFNVCAAHDDLWKNVIRWEQHAIAVCTCGWFSTAFTHKLIVCPKQPTCPCTCTYFQDKLSATALSTLYIAALSAVAPESLEDLSFYCSRVQVRASAIFSGVKVERWHLQCILHLGWMLGKDIWFQPGTYSKTLELFRSSLMIIFSSFAGVCCVMNWWWMHA